MLGMTLELRDDIGDDMRSQEWLSWMTLDLRDDIGGQRVLQNIIPIARMRLCHSSSIDKSTQPCIKPTGFLVISFNESVKTNYLDCMPWLWIVFLPESESLGTLTKKLIGIQTDTCNVTFRKIFPQNIKLILLYLAVISGSILRDARIHLLLGDPVHVHVTDDVLHDQHARRVLGNERGETDQNRGRASCGESIWSENSAFLLLQFSYHVITREY